MNYITHNKVFSEIKLRGAQSHKGSYGSVLAVAGSAEYRGAAALCCLGALRGGAGLVTLAAPETVIQSIAGSILEATFLPLPSQKLFEKAESYSCVAFGCGLENGCETMSLAAQLLPAAKQIVLDAGGLVSIKNNLQLLQTAKSAPIITPHPGEMSALCGKTIDEIQANREQTAADFAKQHNVIVVLKGKNTIISSPTGETWQNSTGNAGLARGGSGDILTGIISALYANGLSAIDAAVFGAYLHGYAADLCSARLSMKGMLPHDILNDLCTVFKDNGR